LDYVVAGFGIGAIVALIGFALWELYGNSDEPGHGWLTRAAIGAMLGSLVIWAVTGVTLISTLDDTTASNLVTATSVITILAIAAGTIWYWRADQAVLASMPPRPVQMPKVQSAVSVAPTAADVESSEWDSWPDREERPADPGDAQTDSPAEPSFEPEVAAKPAAAETVLIPERAESKGAEAANDEDVVAEDTVIAVAVEPPADRAADSLVEADVPAIEEPEPESADVPEAPPEVEVPIAALPAHIPPRRDSKAETKAELVKSEGPQPAKMVPGNAVVEVGDDGNSADPMESPKPESSTNGAQPAVDRAPSPAFESSLLADIDSGSVEGDGRYQSPLLADLEKNPDELEGVGLAKWRPDARLTDEPEAKPPAPGRRGRRR
jgi:hypothetical protein